MTPQKWIDSEISKPQYDGQPPERIAAYLNARPLVIMPSTGTVTVPLGIEEVTQIVADVAPDDWVTVADGTKHWSDVVTATVSSDNLAAKKSAIKIDAAMTAAGEFSPTLKETVAFVIKSGDIAMSIGLIAAMLEAEQLSAEAASALQAAMEKPKPSVYIWGKSIAEEAVYDNFMVSPDQIVK
jgi:hypothetical protein